MEETILDEDVAEAEDLKQSGSDIAVYKYYFQAVGSWKLFVFIFFVILNVFSGAFSSMYQVLSFVLISSLIAYTGIWLKWWSENDGHQILLYTSVYFLLAIGCSLGTGGYAWYFTLLGPKRMLLTNQGDCRCNWTIYRKDTP
jgi:hypothetical protein